MDIVNQYNETGFVILDSCISPKEMQEIIAALDEGGVFDYTNSSNLVHSVPVVNFIANAGVAYHLAKAILGNNARVLNAFVLDKTDSNNWVLDWHRDSYISVKQRIDTTGYTNWRVSNGIQQVEAPEHILQQMLAVRIHLDDCDDTNGAVLAIPGSHSVGYDGQNIVGCHVKAGGVMLMSPLLLHQSPPSASGKSRRILHIEYTATGLDNGLEWL